jgi:hypothetical protein
MEQERVLNRRGRGWLGLGLALFLVVHGNVLGEWLGQVARVHPLGWDVVTYHLPNVLDYLQARSLWALTGTFSQYPAGSEVLLLWSFVPWRSEALLGIQGCLVALALGGAVGLVWRSLVPGRSPFWWGMGLLLLLAGCLSLPFATVLLFDFGKNDLDVAFYGLLLLWGLLQWYGEQVRPRFWLVALGLMAGVAVGIKPNAAYYVLGIGGLVALRRWRSLLWFGLPIPLGGGFWYGRNLLTMGKIFDSTLVASSMDLSVIRNLTNPDLYLPRPELAALVLAIATVFVTLIFFGRREPLRLVALFLAVAIAAFVMTPNGLYRLEFAGGSTSYLQLRYGIIVVPLTGMLWLGMLLERFAPWSDRLAQSCERPGRAASWWVVGPMVVMVAGAIALQLLTYRSPEGLPGFDHILFAPGPQTSKIYQWVQSLPVDQPKTLYSVGLRPFGLYGRGWQNRVIDGGSPRTWQLNQLSGRSGQPGQTGRSPAVDYLLLSLDPFTGDVPLAITELRRRPREFRPVYADDLAAVFEVVNPPTSGSAVHDGTAYRQQKTAHQG